MSNTELIVKHLQRKLDAAQKQLNDNPSMSVKTVLCSMISCYRVMLRYIETLPKENNTSEKDDVVLHGWLSKSGKDGQVWLHYCEGKPELINKEWVGNEYDMPMDNKLFPNINALVPKEIDIVLKIK